MTTTIDTHQAKKQALRHLADVRAARQHVERSVGGGEFWWDEALLGPRPTRTTQALRIAARAEADAQRAAEDAVEAARRAG